VRGRGVGGGGIVNEDVDYDDGGVMDEDEAEGVGELARESADSGGVDAG
jgi:hypothetical protein